MQHFTHFEDENLVNALMNYSIGILPTDTLYGVVGKALSVPVVERIYTVKKRTVTKKLIILIGDLSDLETFFVTLTAKQKTFLASRWPDKFTVELPCTHPDLAYLHKDTYKLAFRMPAHTELRKLINQVGPLVAPSANLEGETPAKTIKQAQDYFNSDVDFYLDGGELDSAPSTLIGLDNDTIKVFREGAVAFEEKPL